MLSTGSFDWNLESINICTIVNSFGQGKCAFDCQSGNLKNYASFETGISGLVYIAGSSIKTFSPRSEMVKPFTTKQSIILSFFSKVVKEI